jgi:hypothetical protein
MSKKPHKADLPAGTPEGFRVVFLKGPMQRFSEEAPTEAKARVVARKLNKLHGSSGRRACIYAIVAGSANPIKDQER